MAWVTDAAISELLTEWGVTLGTGAATGCSVLAQTQVEAELGWPVLKLPSTSQLFDSPDPLRSTVLHLPGPWADITTVTVGVGYQQAGTELVEGRDFRSISTRLPDGTIVSTGIRFFTRVPPLPLQVQIEGDSGVWADGSVPADLARAGALIGAAYLQAQASAVGDSSDVTETRTGQVTVKFGRAGSVASWNGLTARGKAAVDQALAVIEAYKLRRVY